MVWRSRHEPRPSQPIASRPFCHLSSVDKDTLPHLRAGGHPHRPHEPSAADTW